MKAKSPIAGVCCGSSVMDLDTGDSREDRHHGSVSLGLRRCIGDDFEQNRFGNRISSHGRDTDSEILRDQRKQNRRLAGLASRRCLIQRPLWWRMGLWEGAWQRAFGISDRRRLRKSNRDLNR